MLELKVGLEISLTSELLCLLCGTDRLRKAMRRTSSGGHCRYCQCPWQASFPPQEAHKTGRRFPWTLEPLASIFSLQMQIWDIKQICFRKARAHRRCLLSNFSGVSDCLALTVSIKQADWNNARFWNCRASCFPGCCSLQCLSVKPQTTQKHFWMSYFRGIEAYR